MSIRDMRSMGDMGSIGGLDLSWDGMFYYVNTALARLF